MTKYIFVTGGVVSGLGKGITAASLGRLLKARGLKVAAQKLDPYINVDPGTMSPYQHGEVYVKLSSSGCLHAGPVSLRRLALRAMLGPVVRLVRVVKSAWKAGIAKARKLPGYMTA